MFDTIYHQFEVRYIPILNFSEHAKSLISPYLGMSENFSLTAENTQHQKIEVLFKGGYQIVLSYDRVVIRVISAINKLEQPGSIIYEPFLSMVQKIADFPGFSRFIVALHYGIALTEISSYSNETFMKKYISPTLHNVIDNKTNDSRITLQDKTDNFTVGINFSPFFGKVDLKKFAFPISEEHFNRYGKSSGLVIESTIIERDFSKVTGSMYSNLNDRYIKILDNLWKQV